MTKPDYMKVFFAMRFAIIYLFFLIICVPHSDAQEIVSEKIKSFKTLTEKIYGLDDMLVNGKMYRQLSDIESHPYFLTNTWKQGSITVNGNSYEDVLLKYNLHLDRVILGSVALSGSFRSTLLFDRFVNEFMIDSHHFIKVSILSNDKRIKGYVELITDEEPYFIIKHKKNYGIYRKSYEAGNNRSFYHNKPLYFFCNEGKITRVSNQKSFLNYFLNHKKEIRQFIKNNNIDFSKASVSELQRLIIFCKPFLTPTDE